MSVLLEGLRGRFEVSVDATDPIVYHHNLLDHSKRPMPILSDGEPITELM